MTRIQPAASVLRVFATQICLWAKNFKPQFYDGISLYSGAMRGEAIIVRWVSTNNFSKMSVTGYPRYFPLYYHFLGAMYIQVWQDASIDELLRKYFEQTIDLDSQE